MHTLQRMRAFFFKNNLTCLSHLLTLASEGHARTNHPDSLCVGIIIVCILRNLDETIGHLLHPAYGSLTRLPARIVLQHYSMKKLTPILYEKIMDKHFILLIIVYRLSK